MVTARELKIALRMDDSGFQGRMKKATTASNTFKKEIQGANRSVKDLAKTLEKVELGGIESRISFDIVINEKALKESIQTYIEKIKSSKRFPKLPMRINTSTIKESVEDFIEGTAKGTRLKHVPLRISEGTLKESIETFLEKVEKWKADDKKLHIGISKKTLEESFSEAIKEGMEIPVKVGEKPFKESLDDFVETMRPKTIPVRISEKTMKESIERFIEKTASGTRLKHLPLRVSEGILKESIEDAIKKVSKKTSKDLGIEENGLGEKEKKNIENLSIDMKDSEELLGGMYLALQKISDNTDPSKLAENIGAAFLGIFGIRV